MSNLRNVFSNISAKYPIYALITRREINDLNLNIAKYSFFMNDSEMMGDDVLYIDRIDQDDATPVINHILNKMRASGRFPEKELDDIINEFHFAI